MTQNDDWFASLAKIHDSAASVPDALNQTVKVEFTSPIEAGLLLRSDVRAIFFTYGVNFHESRHLLSSKFYGVNWSGRYSEWLKLETEISRVFS